MTQNVQKMLKDSAYARWAVLILISLTMFFAYFFVDLASPIKNQFEINYRWSSEVFGMYGGMEFFFNVFFAFLILSGIILDKMGIRFTLVTSGVMMVLGALIKLYAIQFLDRSVDVTVFDFSVFGYYLGYTLPATAAYASLGFAVFGIGVEMAGITVSKTIVKWFKGKEMALAMGLEMAIARLGVFAVMNLSPIFANNSSTNPQEWTTSNAFLWGLIFLIIGFLTFLIYTFMDKVADKEESAALANSGNDSADESEEFKFSDLKQIFTNPGFLAIAGLCVLFYSAIFPFQRFATEMLSSRLLISPKDSAFYVSLFPIGAMILTPFIGFFLDKKGLGAKLMFVGAVLLTASHLIFALVPTAFFSTYVAIGTIVVLGISFSLVPASMWPSLPKIVEERCLGTAYGAIFWVQNMGLLAVPILIGWVLNTSNPGVQDNIALINDNIKEMSLHIEQLDSLSNKAIVDLENYSQEFDNSQFTEKHKEKAFLCYYLKESTEIIKTEFEELGFKIFVVESRKPIVQRVSAEIAKVNSIVAGFPALENESNINNKEFIQSLDHVSSNMKRDIAKFNDFSNDVVYNYTMPQLVFAGFGVLAILLSLLLQVINRRKKYGLDLPNAKH